MPDPINLEAEPSPEHRPVRALRIRRVCERTDLAQSTLYKLVAEGKFPKPFKLGSVGWGAAAAWLESEVEDWIMERAKVRVDSTALGLASRERGAAAQ